jgi:hypothetical protein
VPKFAYQPKVSKAPYLKAMLLAGLTGFSLLAKPVEPNNNREVHAELLFQKKNYLGAWLWLKDADSPTLRGHLLVAESLFRLGRFKEAQAHYAKLLQLSDESDKPSIYKRIFDSKLRAGDLQGAIAAYNEYKKQYEEVPALMHYALGKALFDAGERDRASKILLLVARGELYIRARYLIATIGIDSRPAEASINLYKEIEGLPTLCVEDHSIKPMAILAQARLYHDKKRDDLALKTYERVPLVGPMGETATIEQVRILIARAERALYREGAYAKASEEARLNSEREAIAKALSVIERYRKVSEIDWRKPELHTLMAFIFVKNRRYNEARLAYAELIDHYRALYRSLVDTKAENAQVWPAFLLKTPAPNKLANAALPDELLKTIPEVRTILHLKREIEEREQRLELFLEHAEVLAGTSELELAKANQESLVKGYEALVKIAQNNINKKSALLINTTLAEAEYRRGELSRLEMGDLKKQLDVNREFQSKKIDNFEKDLSKLDQGGSL